MAFRTVAVLALPFLLLCIPLVAGYRWSAIGPEFATVPPVPGLEAYAGRRPSLPISIEAYGTSVAIIPFRAHVRAYLQDGDPPLWNPYAGLGQPLAAQGEGGPYSPLAILRALLPADWANGFTFGVYLLSALALSRMLRLLGLSSGAAALGGAAWALSGALTLHIPRENLADQLAMIPPLFLAATWAVRSGRIWAHAVFAVVTALFCLAGFLQIGVNALLLLVPFVAVLGYLHAPTRQTRLVTIGMAYLFLALGALLASPYLLPIVESVGAAHHKNAPFLAFIPMPTANVVSFFVPLLFGQPLRGWLEGGYPEVADWNNLFAYGSVGLVMLTVFGLAALRQQRHEHRVLFLFFLGGLVFFLARYVSFPPIGLINVLPILSQQSPKHTNGVAVFCLVVAAAFGAEWLRRADGRRVVWMTLGLLVALVSTVLTIVGRQGARISIQPDVALLALGTTGLLVALVMLGLWRARSTRTDDDATFIAAAVVLGELAVYLPLGNGDREVIGARVAVFGLIVSMASLVVLRARVLAGLSGLLALTLYAWVVMVPATGLPQPLDSNTPRPYMSWLQSATADGSRVFGIQPDFAGIAGLRDIEAAGPLAPPEYLTFVGLIGTPEIADRVRYGSTFSLIEPHARRPMYDLAGLYPRARPILDWFAVRYLVLDRRVFGTQATPLPLDQLRQLPNLTTAYEDETFTILASGQASSRAVFAVAARSAGSSDEALTPMRANPTAINGPVLVEAPGEALRSVRVRSDGPAQLPVPLAEDRRNAVRATFDAPSPGVFVLKDSVYPGWTATLDGRDAEIFRVNGMVRGVIVPTAGRHEVVMRYRPVSFTAGLALSVGASLALIGLGIWGGRRLGSAPKREQPVPDRLAVHR